jgi:hypothetical protein
LLGQLLGDVASSFSSGVRTFIPTGAPVSI